MKKMKVRLNRFVPLLLAVIAPIAFSGRYTVPMTHRKAMILVEEDTGMQVGVSGCAEIKKETKIPTDPAVRAQVQWIGKRIAAATG